ncbi:hypothetical protein PR048_027309 [Dryococelus australis]|uniref:DDE Tnp4 domain-containing protein n=1 Tax=Dryococelus australis TaxID=614101 RepID=A0ABQ9GGM5_9NEOP|nr:hypothetical protein PR048_027309 [Dryococelus australis]
MAVVDHDYCFRYIHVGSYGHNADGSVLQRSSLFPVLKEEGFLVGDDAFPLKPYLLKTYSSNNLSCKQDTSTYRLSRARLIVENAFGVLPYRFRVFGKPIQVKVTATEIMVTPGTLDYEYIVRGCVKPGSWSADISELPSLLR